MTDTYLVDDLRIDVGQQRVTRGATDIALPKLSFDMLVALVRAAPNVVSSSELMALVWPGLVVSPETVNQRIKLLRDALGDDAKDPRYITGLRGRGYRVAAAVAPAPAVEADAAISSGGVAESAATGVPRRSAKTGLILGLLIALLTIAALVVPRARERLHRTLVAIPPDSATSAPASESARHTVAVLPFDNVGGTDSDAYLALGIPEMILDRLSGVPGLTVIARGSSFRTGAPAVDPREVGKRLNAGFLVEGSVQRLGDTLRVTARLIDAGAGTQLWSARLDRHLKDVFATQDEIAARVTDALAGRIPLAGAPPMRASGPRSSNVEAELAYLRGRALLGRHTVGDSEAAAAEFAIAVELDPGFAAAYASLFDARLLTAERRHDDLAPERRRQSSLIEKALRLDPGSGAAYFARAIWADSEPAQREADFLRGAELDPSNGRGLTAFEEFLDGRDRHAEGLEWLQRALAVDPLSPRAHFRLVQRSFGQARPAEIEAGMLKVLELDPTYHPALQRYAKYRWILDGQTSDALQTIERAIAVDPLNPWSRHTAVAMYLDAGDSAAAIDVAAGTAQSADASRVLLALYRGDWQAAGEAALATTGREYNRYESWGVSEAARDYALRSGRRRRTLEFLEQRFQLAGTVPLSVEQLRPAATAAELLIADGAGERGRGRLRQVIAAVDASVPIFGPVFALRTKATAMLLLGERDAALAQLAASFQANDYTLWWYTLERDPLWAPLREDPRFKVIAAEVRRHQAAERVALEDLRRRGLVPVRTGAAAAQLAGPPAPRR